jgi:ubiquinone/menaquinone biosynthesis C-methylase UbiE
MVKIAMGGKLVLAPIDLVRSGLRVLDSATADGYWLVDLASSISQTATLIGTDLHPQHFITNLPKNISLSTHSIFDTWPVPFQNSFDLVHQRFVLPICSDEASVDAVKKLFACVKQEDIFSFTTGT